MSFRFFSTEENTQKFLDIFGFEDDALINIRVPDWEEWVYLESKIEYTSWKIKFSESFYKHISGSRTNYINTKDLRIRCGDRYVKEITAGGTLFTNRKIYEEGYEFKVESLVDKKIFDNIVLPGIIELKKKFPNESIEISESIYTIENIKIKPMDYVEIQMSIKDNTPLTTSISFCDRFKTEVSVPEDLTVFIWNLITPIIINNSKNYTFERFLLKRYIEYIEKIKILDGAEGNNNPLIKLLSNRFNKTLEEFRQ